MTEKLSLLTELIKLSRADKECRDVEYEFIMSIAKTLGVPPADVEPLFNQYIAFTPPRFETGRILQFHRMVLLSHVDLEVDQRELDHMREVGMKMALHPDAIEAVFQEMAEHENGMVPSDVLIGIFQVYHN